MTLGKVPLGRPCLARSCQNRAIAIADSGHGSCVGSGIL